MDFMKTLLIYMTTVFALTVQNTAAPSVTPEHRSEEAHV